MLSGDEAIRGRAGPAAEATRPAFLEFIFYQDSFGGVLNRETSTETMQHDAAGEPFILQGQQIAC
jgi:hypothetical protein